MGRFEGFHGGRGGRRKGRKQGWVSSRDMRDSSPALPAGSPQRWQSRCKLNLVCGCWLVRSSLGSARSEEGGLLPSGGRHSSVDRNRVCNLRGVRPLRPLARLAVHPPFSSSLSLSSKPTGFSRFSVCRNEGRNERPRRYTRFARWTQQWKRW